VGIQMFFLGSESTSTITAQSAVVSKNSTSSASVSITFTTLGVQFTTANSSNVILGNWVSPATTADEWEIRATLDSGNTPTGTLGVWQDFSVNRSWGLSISDPGSLEAAMTFEFRRVGDTPAEFTITGNSLSVEVFEIL
jgi:hypothetical protein